MNNKVNGERAKAAKSSKSFSAGDGMVVQTQTVPQDGGVLRFDDRVVSEVLTRQLIQLLAIHRCLTGRR